MTGTRRVISHITCLNANCKATVEARVNKNEKVYYFCDGHMDDKQCGGAWKYGATDSRKMIAQAAKLKTQQEESENEDGEETSTDENSTKEIAGQEDGNDTGHDGREPKGDRGDSEETGRGGSDNRSTPSGVGVF